MTRDLAAESGLLALSVMQRACQPRCTAMTYDHWKTTNPADAELGSAPQAGDRTEPPDDAAEVPEYYECHCGRYHEARFHHIDAPAGYTFAQVELLHPVHSGGWRMVTEPLMRNGDRWYEPVVEDGV